MKYLSSLILFSLSFTLTVHVAHGHNGSNGHNYIHELNVNYYLYNICKDDIEGYTRKTGGGDYGYPSLREDLGQAMISRASTGKVYFEFLTGEVPSNYSGENISFFFLSDIDLNLRQPYDVVVNDKPTLTFQVKEDGTLTILANPGNGDAQFYLIKRDHNSDGIGAFRLTVPVEAIQKGASAKVKIQGHKKGSNSWFMIFKGEDVISRLKASVENEVAYSIRQQGEILHIDAPAFFEGRNIQLVSDGKKSKKVPFVKDGEIAKAKIKQQVATKTFELICNGKSATIYFPDGNGISTQTEIVGYYFLYHKTYFQNGWNATFVKAYRPDFFNIYNDFFDRKYEEGKIAIMNSSHQDIAWVDRPEVCIILRDTLLLTPIIKDASERPDYGFDIEDGLMLREYMERHPDAKDQIATLLNKNLLSVGATYNCPYEDMYDSEDQVRQLYLGKKWVKKLFNYDSKVYWNVDVPGKSLQTPQILKKAGVDYMVISRHAKGMFHWESPDGSTVFTYSPGHYGNDLIHLSKEMGNKIKYGAEQVVYWDEYYKQGNNHTPLLSSQDMLPAIDYSDYIDSWNSFSSVKDHSGKAQSVYFPEMEVMTTDEFMSQAEKHATDADTIRGERPNVWLYIHGPSHHDALTASRTGSKLIPAAEKFNLIAYLLDPSKMPYPANELNDAWLAKIYPDHGWGGHDGDITDNLFKEKLVQSRVMGEKLLDRATSYLAGQIQTNENNGIPVVLFNSLSWQRVDPVSVSMEFQKNEANNVAILSHEKNTVPSQLSNTVYHEDGSIKSATITFVANVPSIGYSTYYIQKLEPRPKAEQPISSASEYENNFYKATITKGGIAQIFDKELKRNLFKTDEYTVGDIFTLQSIGNGAGEFGDVQQPTMQDFDQVSAHGTDVELIESGDVFATYRIRQQIRHAIVEQDITFFNEIKQIKYETKLLNWSGEMFREFRTAFPVNMNNPVISYEVPFGSVEVGKDEIKTAGERYTPLCKDVHPRALIDWISATNDDMTITLSSSVAVADWIDPANEKDKGLLQHILLASRRSCHWEGNEYSQAGNHTYSHILTSSQPEKHPGSRMAKQHNEPIRVIVYPDKAASARLPEQNSFFNIDRENVIITAIKKAEDSNQIVFRMYDTEGEHSSVKVNSAFDLGKIFKTNIIEEYPQEVTAPQIGKFGIETFLMEVNQQ